MQLLEHLRGRDVDVGDGLGIEHDGRHAVLAVVAFAGVLVLRPRGRLHFGNVRRTNEGIVAAIEASDPAPRVVILDVVAVPDLEITAVAGLHDLAVAPHERGTELWVASLTPDEQRMIERYGGDDGLPLFGTPREAVTAARSAYAGRP